MKLIGQNTCHDEERTLPVTIAGVPCQISGMATIAILIIDAKKFPQWLGRSAFLILGRALVMIKHRTERPFPQSQHSGAVAHRPAAGMAAEF